MLCKERITFEHRLTEYVLAPDAYAAKGVRGLLRELGRTCTELSDDSALNSLDKLHVGVLWRLSIIMPSEPLPLLIMIEKLSHLVRCSSRPPRVLILSLVPANWMLLTLIALGCPPGMLVNFTILPARINCASLSVIMSGGELTQGAYLSLPPPIMTPREYRVVSDWLAGRSAQACADSANRSVKTLYAQRYNGLCKLAFIFPELRPRSRPHPRLKKSRRKKSPARTISQKNLLYQAPGSV